MLYIHGLIVRYALIFTYITNTASMSNDLENITEDNMTHFISGQSVL